MADVILQYKNFIIHVYLWDKRAPSPALCESFIVHRANTEAVGAVVPGVGNSATKKLLEELWLAQRQITPLCFNKWSAPLYNVDLSVIKLVHILEPQGTEPQLAEMKI